MPRNIPNPSTGSIEDFAISKNTGTLKLVELEFYEEFSSTSSGTISKVPQNIDLEFPIINYSNEWEDQMNFDADLYAPNTDAPFQKFLSKIPYTTTQPNETNGMIAHLTGAGDYRTISWLNESSTYFNTSPLAINYKFYSQVPDATLSNYTGQIYLPNTTTYGGSTPASSSGIQTKMLLFASAGYENVAKLK